MGTWRRWRPRLSGLFALAVILVGPAAARAQLFPDIYIKRQRPCCAAEDPRYRVIREQYFGYYPTCWRKFPSGWGCPSPEAPNFAASLERLPRELPPDLSGEGDPGLGPDLPDRESPFRRPDAGDAPGGLGQPPLPDDDDLFGIPPANRDGLNRRDPFREGSAVPPALGNPGDAPARPAGGTGPLLDGGPRTDSSVPGLDGFWPDLSVPGSEIPTAALPGPIDEASLPPGSIGAPTLGPLPGLGTLPPLDDSTTGVALGFLGEAPAAPPLVAPTPPGARPFPPVSIEGPVGGRHGIIDPTRGDTLDGGADPHRPPHAHNHAPARRGPIASALGRLRNR